MQQTGFWKNDGEEIAARHAGGTKGYMKHYGSPEQETDSTTDNTYAWLRLLGTPITKEEYDSL